MHAPTATPTNAMVAVAGIRWRIEECNEQGKDLIGLDQHQIRTWTAFHHHVAVCMFAHAFAATRKARLHAGEPAADGAHRGNGQATSPTWRRQPATATGDAMTNGGSWPRSPTSSPSWPPGCNRPATAPTPSGGCSGSRLTAYAPRSATTSAEANDHRPTPGHEPAPTPPHHDLQL